MSQYLVSDTSLLSVANAIRNAGGTTGSLIFPTGFVNAIGAISSGGGGGGGGTGSAITGTVTPTTNNANVVINFGRTIERYMFLIEMTDSSLQALADSGIVGNRAYAFNGLYKHKKIANVEPSLIAMYVRYNPDTGAASSAQTAISNTDNTQLSIKSYNLDTASSTTLIVGYTYTYIIIPLENEE